MDHNKFVSLFKNRNVKILNVTLKKTCGCIIIKGYLERILLTSFNKIPGFFKQKLPLH